MGNESSYKIKIETGADTAGADRAAASMIKLGDAAKAALASAKTAAADIATAASAPAAAIDNVVKVTEADIKKAAAAAGGEGAEGFKVFGRGAHEAHAALRALNEAFPGLEGMARFLANPMVAAIGLVVYAFSKFKEAVKQFSDDLDTLNQQSQRGNWAEKLATDAREAAVETAKFSHEMETLAGKQQTLEEKTAALITRQKEQEASANTVASAQKEADEARVDLLEKLGTITQEQAIKLKLDIDEQYFKAQLQAKVAGLQAELNARGNEWMAARNAELPTNNALQTAQARFNAAKAAKDKNEGKLEQDQASLAELEKNDQAAQAIIDRLKGHGEWAGHYDPTDPQYHDLKAAEDTIEQNKLIRQNLQSSIGQEKGRSQGVDKELALASTDLDTAKQNVQDTAKAVKDATQQIKDLTLQLTALKAENSTLETLHGQAASDKASAELAGIADRRREEEARTGHYANTPQGESDYAINEANAAAAALQSGAAGAGGSVQQALALLTSVVNEHVDRTQEDRAALRDTISRLSHLESQVQSHRFQ